MTDLLQRRNDRDLETADPATRVAIYRDMLRVAPACGRCNGRRFTSPMRAIEPSTGEESSARLVCSACRGAGSMLKMRFELAAYAGDPVARAALCDRIFGAAAEAGTVDFQLWVTGFARWGNDVLAMALEHCPVVPRAATPGQRLAITETITTYALDAAALRACQRGG